MACASPNCACGRDDGAQPANIGPALAVPPSLRSPFGPEALLASLAGARNASDRLQGAEARLASIAAQRGRPVVPAPRPVAGAATPQLVSGSELSSPFVLRPISVEKPAASSAPAATAESAAGDSPLMQVSTVQPAKTATLIEQLPIPVSPERRGREAVVGVFTNVTAPRPQPVSAERLTASLDVGGVTVTPARPAVAPRSPPPVLSPGAAWSAGMRGRGIKPEELVGMVAQSLEGRRMTLPTEQVTILDVRTAAEFTAGHVEGAINAPNGLDEAVLARLGPKSGKVVVYCETGRRAVSFADELARHGVANVVNAGSVAAAAAVTGRVIVCSLPVAASRNRPHPIGDPGALGSALVRLNPSARLGRARAQLSLPTADGIVYPCPVTYDSLWSSLPFRRIDGDSVQWTRLALDLATLNKPTSWDGRRVPDVLSAGDLLRNIPLAGAGGSASQRNILEPIQFSFGSRNIAAVTVPRSEDDHQPVPVDLEQAPQTGFLSFRLCDVARVLAARASCQSVWSGGRPCVGNHSWAGCVAPLIDGSIACQQDLHEQQRDYGRFAMPPGSAIQISLLLRVRGEPSNPIDAGDASLLAECDGVFAGVGQSHPDPRKFVNQYLGLSNESSRTALGPAFCVGWGDGRFYGGQSTTLRSETSVASIQPSFLAHGNLVFCRPLPPEGEMERMPYFVPPDVVPRPAMLTQMRRATFLPNEWRKALLVRPDYLEKERAASARGLPATRSVQFELTFFAPVSRSQLTLRPGTGEHLVDGRFWPVRVLAAGLDLKGKVFSHRFSRTASFAEYDVTSTRNEVTTILPDRDVAITVGCFRQSLADANTLSVSLDCVQARFLTGVA